MTNLPPPPSTPQPPSGAPQPGPSTLAADSPSAGLSTTAGVAAVLACVMGAASSIRQDRRLGVTDVPEAPALLGAAIGALIIPTVVGFIAWKTSSPRTGTLVFIVLCVLIIALGVLRLALNFA